MPGGRFLAAAALVCLVLASAPHRAVPQSAVAAEPQGAARLGAGFRFSTYGPEFDPGPEYWAEVGRAMASKFPAAAPESLWIVGRLEGEGTHLSFPVAAKGSPLITGATEDLDAAALSLFDAMGMKVWLQVEPGNAPVEELIHVVLERYGDHPCVVGFGVDVEWYRSVDRPEGRPVSDQTAARWLAAVRSHDPSYRLFLKHWEIGKMPPTLRDGLYFVDDSQIFPSLDAMVEEFAAWGRAFSPAPVGFQFGYESDREWWRHLEDPPLEIGRRIMSAVANLEGLYWVDFTVLDVFPPQPRDLMVGVKTYAPEGSFEEIFDQWRDLGVDTAFVSQTLLEDPEFRAMARERAVDVFVITPVFFNPEDLAEEPDLFAVTAGGDPAKADWVEFVCPSRPGYRERRRREIVELVRRHRPDGVSLDFVRHFVFWEMLRPETAARDLPNTCFCPHCLADFAAWAGLEIPATGPEAAEWILERHSARWSEWKVHLITTMVERLVEELAAEDPDLRINLHAVPWRRDDYRGAIRSIAGQDFAALSSLVDYLSPMTYSFMLRREPTWIHSVVEEVSAASAAGVVPSIQVGEAYRLGEGFSVDEFESALREALRPPSDGVVFWSWEALAREPAKLRVARKVLREVAADPRP